MIIGLTGKNGSGKGEAAAYLQKKGFEYHSLSDVLRKEAERLNIEKTRDNLFQLGNKMRDEEGAEVLAKRILKDLDVSRNIVIDSIRHPDEAAALRAAPEFFLWVVDASAEVRFERMRHRAREKDPQSLDVFLELEAKEAESDNPTDQQLKKTLECADIVVQNEGGLEKLYGRIDQLLQNPKSMLTHKNN